MSISLMTLAWKSDQPSGRKMVLLALCDNANDQGECFPSIAMLAKKCSMGLRTVQQHITDMQTDGILRREMRPGRSTIYHLDTSRFNLPTPAESAPRRICTPQISHPTPADFAPITIKEPSVEPSGNRQRARGGTSLAVVQPDLPDWLPLEAWNGFLEMRKRHKPPLTDHGVKLVITELRKLADEGHDPEAVLNQSVMNGWKGVFRLKGNPTGRYGGPERRQAEIDEQNRAANAEAKRMLFGKSKEVVDV